MRRPFFLGVIPARGGSKGIPAKNIVPLAGKPLIAHSIEAARGSRLLSRCIVSTDSEEIASVARGLGAEVPFLRPAVLAGDRSPSIDLILHAVSALEGAGGARVEHVVLLQPTSPLRTSRDIDLAIGRYLASPGADSLISCHRAGRVHPRIMYRPAPGNRLRPLWPAEGGGAVRRQDFEEVYIRNGAIYIASRELVMARKRLIGDEPLLYAMPEDRSINIDEPEDLERARRLLEGSREAVPS